MNETILLSIGLPVLSGLALLVSSFVEHIRNGKESEKNRKKIHIYTGIVLVLSVILAMYAAWSGEKTLVLFPLVDQMTVYFHVDALGSFFVTVVSIVWLAVGAFSFVYMKHEGDEKRFFGFFLALYGVLVGLDFSGNLVTMYLFYELMTLVSFPLVLHNRSREAIMGALKYLFYSMCGAYAGLFGIFVLYKFDKALIFKPGGIPAISESAGHSGLLLIALLCMLIGFGAKAGMFPLHAWLPTAHPVAPSPASASLSGIIVKSGVLAIIRTVYYIVGPEVLRGTWVQYVWMILSLTTVFMGSMLAFREKVFKKRLAYSTVSQVSYILFGLSVLSPMAFQGALMHVAAHAFIKSGLFLTAGVFIYRYGYTRVEELVGIAKRIPVVMWCYTFFALALIGIPPTSGFISKWYLAGGALESGIPFFSWFGPAILLVSALLTAGYLLPITMKGFFPGEKQQENDTDTERNSVEYERDKLSGWMVVPLIVLAVIVVLLGLFPNRVLAYFNDIAILVFG